MVRGLLCKRAMESALRKYVLTVNLLFLAVCAAIFAHAARVVVDSGLSIAQAARVARSSPAPCATAALPPSRTSAGLAPAADHDRLAGIRLFSLRSGDFLSRLGLHNGDVLESVDEIRLDSPERALDAYARLRAALQPVLLVQREGRPLTLTPGRGD
jgi:hypothetical protein